MYEEGLDSLLSEFWKTQSQLTSIREFVEGAESIDWEEEFNSGFGEFQSRLGRLTQWARCRVEMPPDPRRMVLATYRRERDQWLRLYKAADQKSDLCVLKDVPGSVRELWRAEEGEQVVAYARNPKRLGNPFLLLAYRSELPTPDESDRVVRELLLGAIVLLGGTALANRPIYFLDVFRKRFDQYECLARAVEQLNRGEGLRQTTLREECLRLEQRIRRLPPGHPHAAEFEELVGRLLSWVFDPFLSAPMKQEPLYGGSKRIDLVYTNRARSGFWSDLPSKYLIPCPYVFVECKNYSREVGNPEVDQLLGRFAVARGKVGLLVCSQIFDRLKLLDRCREAARDGRGWILALDQDDLVALLHARLLDRLESPKGEPQRVWELLEDHFRMLTF